MDGYSGIFKDKRGIKMGMQYKSGFCKQCGEQRKVERKGTNHILHLILSVLTVGVWVIIWIGTSIKFGGWRCGTCGSTQTAKVR
jgi:hypothetical protein